MRGPTVPGPPAISEPPEITLRDVFEVLTRRRRLAAAIFAGAMLLAVVSGVLTPSRYEARASVLLLNERETTVHIITSDAFFARVAARLPEHAFGGGDNATLAGFALRERGDVTVTPGLAGTTGHDITRISASSASPERAKQILVACLDALGDLRPVLDEVIRENRWPAFYEAAGRNATLAEAQLKEFVAGLNYYTVVESGTSQPHQISPDWEAKIVIGAGFGALGAIFVPFFADAVANARRAPGPVRPEEAAEALSTDSNRRS